MIDETTLVKGLLAEQIRLLGYIQSIVRRHDLAADIFQDVCVLAIQKRHQLQDEDHLRKWMRTTARLEALNVLTRRQNKTLSLDTDVADLMDQCWEEEDQLESSLLAEALRHCIPGLSPANRSLVEKRFVENYDYVRLSKEINRPVSSLYVTFSRIYSSLAKCISDRMLHEQGLKRQGGSIA